MIFEWVAEAAEAKRYVFSDVTDPPQKDATLPPTHSAKSAEWMGHSVSKLLGWIDNGSANQLSKIVSGIAI
jgi:hypothetical protein